MALRKPAAKAQDSRAYGYTLAVLQSLRRMVGKLDGRARSRVDCTGVHFTLDRTPGGERLSVYYKQKDRCSLLSDYDQQLVARAVQAAGWPQFTVATRSTTAGPVTDYTMTSTLVGGNT